MLRQGGRWAGWWTHARADTESWFDASWDAIEAACPGTHRGQRDIDWGNGLRESGLFTVGERITVPWVRHVSTQHWLIDLRSHSYVAALSSRDRDELLNVLACHASEAFPDGEMRVPCETWLWNATLLKRDVGRNELR